MNAKYDDIIIGFGKGGKTIAGAACFYTMVL